jgi:hypothetical protein
MFNISRVFSYPVHYLFVFSQTAVTKVVNHYTTEEIKGTVREDLYDPKVISLDRVGSIYESM